MAMDEWLYEEGIGESRAALVRNGDILEALIEREGGGARAGAVLSGRLARTIIPRRRGIARLDDGEEVLIEPIPPRIAEGAAIRIEILREALAEQGLDGIRMKRATGRVVPAGTDLRPGPTLRQRIEASGLPARLCRAHEPDALEDAGWSALCEEAATGAVNREDASLRLFPTPAMLLIDVDGVAPPAQLGPKGAKLAAQAIRRMGVTGSIGIDLPTMNNKDERLIAAAQIDKYLPQPFERTAVNGFGFVQIIRRRERPSLIELLRGDPLMARAMAALREGERADGGAGPLTLRVAPEVGALIRRHPEWLQRLERTRGGAVVIAAEGAAADGDDDAR